MHSLAQLTSKFQLLLLLVSKTMEKAPMKTCLPYDPTISLNATKLSLPPPSPTENLNPTPFAPVLQPTTPLWVATMIQNTDTTRISLQTVLSPNEEPVQTNSIYTVSLSKMRFDLLKRELLPGGRE